MKVKKIVLEVKGKEVSVSIDEAKELRTVLNEIFEKEIIYWPSPVVVREINPYNPYGSIGGIRYGSNSNGTENCQSIN